MSTNIRNSSDILPYNKEKLSSLKYKGFEHVKVMEPDYEDSSKPFRKQIKFSVKKRKN